jgi:hypothetical protein
MTKTKTGVVKMTKHSVAHIVDTEYLEVLDVLADAALEAVRRGAFEMSPETVVAARRVEALRIEGING